MSFIRYVMVSAICLGMTGVAYADLFFQVEVVERPPRSEFEKWLFVYRNRTDEEFRIHLQVDNDACSVNGKSVLINVLDNTGKVIRSEAAPGYGALAVSLNVPARGRVRLKFRGDTSDGTVFTDCTSSFPRANYHLSEPYPTSLLP